MMKRLLLVIAAALAMLLLSVGSTLAVGPQPLPAAACNDGSLSAPAGGGVSQEEVAHLHDFDGDGIWACYHRNVTYPPASSSLE